MGGKCEVVCERAALRARLKESEEAAALHLHWFREKRAELEQVTAQRDKHMDDARCWCELAQERLEERDTALAEVERMKAELVSQARLHSGADPSALSVALADAKRLREALEIIAGTNGSEAWNPRAAAAKALSLHPAPEAKG